MAMNPLNEASEKNKFLRDKSYIPRFRYQEHGCRHMELLKRINRIKLDDSMISMLLMQKLEKFRKNVLMNKAIGSDDFSRRSIDIFGKPGDALKRKAYGLLKKKDCHEECSVSPEEAVKALRRILSGLGLDDWKVLSKKMTSKAAVRASRKTIYIKRGSLFPEGFINRIASHEIGTHVFRAENGKRQPYKLFSVGLPNYLMTEEGLAVNCEEQNNCLRSRTLHDYAGRAIAVHLALEEGFREVFDEMKKHFDYETAWKLALRAKRGLGDVRKPGAFTKDYVYLEGYHRVKDFLEEKGSAGLRMLYYGKIGFEHLKLLKRIDGLVEPRFVPEKGWLGKI
jgi:uncharacterized protein (TIGR02421 family)